MSVRPPRPLRPVDLGRAVGLSAQQVNRYERWGLLPPAARSPTGRRLYGPEHRHAILALRAMQAGYGWMPANRVMRRVQQNDLPGAVALVDERHAVLHRQRQEVAETLRALETLRAGVPAGASARRRRGAEPAADGPDRVPGSRWRASPDRLRIGEAARRAGVRASAARFWEEQGLLHPGRDPESGFRLYDREQLVRLHVVAVLRQANYAFDAIGAVLDELAGGRPDTALSAIERRREDLARAGTLCSRATAAFWGYVAERFDVPDALSGTLPRTWLAGLEALWSANADTSRPLRPDRAARGLRS